LTEQISIERDGKIRLHIKGTLKSVTRWVTTHEQGIAEWLKNTRRAYFPDRANVAKQHWVAVLLLKDQTHEGARIGLLDVGGLTLEDIEKWCVWQDPEASERTTTTERIEETQGNGGKAYMYNLFMGPARILGVQNDIKNCKGFVGERDTEERGTPGFMPSIQGGKNASTSFLDEIADVLEPYDLTLHDLPEDVKGALSQRCAFTLVEGIRPKGYEKIPVEDLIQKIIKNPQALSPLEQLNVYVFHNGLMVNEKKPLQIEPLPPYPGFDVQRVIEIPESLPDESNILQSTIAGGTKPLGRLILYTSKKDISKRFKYRWTITYRTGTEIVGTICVGELIPPGVPASQFIYGDVELDALSPDYVKLGRDRPNEGPLLSALNIFISEKICRLAEEINEKRIQELDEKILDEVHEENKLLDRWKNKFFSEITEGIIGPGVGGLGEDEAPGPAKRKRGPTAIEWGSEPVKIELCKEALVIGRGVKLHLSTILKPIARDKDDNPTGVVNFEWWSDNPRIARFSPWSDEIEGVQKGSCNVWVKIQDTSICTKIPIDVWEVDHVLLTPRRLEVPLGVRKRIIAEVTNDEGKRKTDVLLNWKHNALDQLIVRIHPTGWVTGNRDGKTIIYAGAGNVWARIGAEAEVIPNPNLRPQGEGFPMLLLTERDIDPETGDVRKGDVDKPPLWQEVSDVKHNIWWLNMQNPQAAFAFKCGDDAFWRMYHAEQVVEMFVQALMQHEYTQKGDDEEPKYWGDHKFTMDEYITQATQAMWEKLMEYVEKGIDVLG